MRIVKALKTSNPRYPVNLEHFFSSSLQWGFLVFKQRHNLVTKNFFFLLFFLKKKQTKKPVATPPPPHQIFLSFLVNSFGIFYFKLNMACQGNNNSLQHMEFILALSVYFPNKNTEPFFCGKYPLNWKCCVQWYSATEILIFLLDQR